MAAYTLSVVLLIPAVHQAEINTLAEAAGYGLFFNGQSYSSVCLGRAATTEELDSTRGWVNDRTGAY